MNGSESFKSQMPRGLHCWGGEQWALFDSTNTSVSPIFSLSKPLVSSLKPLTLIKLVMMKGYTVSKV